MRGFRAPLVTLVSFVPLATPALGGVADTAWIVARSGQAAPGTSGFAFHGMLTDNSGAVLPAPLMSGEFVVLSSSLRQGSSTPAAERGLWLMSGQSGNRLLARQGQIAPDLPTGTTFDLLSSVSSDRSGEVSFIATVTGPEVVPGVNSRALWVADMTNTALALREGQPAPDTSPIGHFRYLIEGTGLDGAAGADLRVRAQVTDLPGQPATLPATSGTWVRQGTVFRMVSWSFGAAPGIDNAWIGDIFDTISCSGRGATVGSIYGPAVGTIVVNGTSVSNNWCVWRASPGDRQLVARTGDSAPGTDPGVVFWTLSPSHLRPAVNRSGDIAFAGMLAGPGVTSANRSGIWRSTATGTTLIVRGGAPALPAGSGVALDPVSVGSSDGSLAVMDNGDTVFWTYFAGTGVTLNNCRGIWKRSPSGQDTMIARSGVSNSALPAGTTLVRTTLPLAMKAVGDDHVMFTAQLTGTGVSSTNNDVLLRHTSAGGLQLVAREGETYGNHVLKAFVNNGADIQITPTGFALVPATFSPAGNPNQTPVPGALGISPSGVARVLAVQNHPIALSDATFPTISQLRVASKGAISDDGRVAMAASFNSGTPRDEGVFVVTIDVGYEPPAPCPADYDQSGAVTSEDLFDFLADWFQGDADYDRSGMTDVADIFQYLSDWFRGCD